MLGTEVLAFLRCLAVKVLKGKSVGPVDLTSLHIF